MIASRPHYWIIPTLTTVIGPTGCGFTTRISKCLPFFPSTMVFFLLTALPITTTITRLIPMEATVEALAAAAKDLRPPRPAARDLRPPRVERAERVVPAPEIRRLLPIVAR